MKILVLLLFVSTTNFIVCDVWKDIELLPELLQPDLRAIENYFNKINKDIYAFVRWPNGITFVVSHDCNTHLKIEGIFTDESCHQDSERDCILYEGLYYKHGHFYVRKPKMSSLEIISKNTPLCYFQTKVPKQKQYLSIRYFALAEIKTMIEQSSYSKYWSYLADDLTNTYYYLAITPDFDHFIEYNICRFLYKPPGADGRLRALISTEKNPRKLSKSVEADMLQLGTPTPTLTVNVSDDEWPLGNVFGLRMATIGFLAEVKGSKIKMFNSDDLTSGKPAKHVISGVDFITKVRKVEPKHMNPDLRICDSYKYQPDSAYLHVLGHILEKRVNFVDGVKDLHCPLIIEHANNNGYFLYGENRVQKLCTSDFEIWVITGDGKRVRLNEFDITLVYTE